MKRIKINNGDIITGYEFKDLSAEVQNKVLIDQVNFEIEVMDEDSLYYDEAVKMDKMQTPWFLAETIFHDHREQLIETIEINEYLFDEAGEMLNVTRHYKDNEFIRATYGKKERECTIEDI